MQTTSKNFFLKLKGFRMNTKFNLSNPPLNNYNAQNKKISFV